MPISVKLSKEEWADLKRDPRFKEVLKAVQALRQEYTDYLAKGATIGAEADTTAQKTALEVGKIIGLDALLEMEVE